MQKFANPRDYGGDGRGRTFGRKNSVQGTCGSCGCRRLYPVKAWSRKIRITCPRCGQYMQPSNHAQKAHPELATADRNTRSERRCERCNAKLNSYNREPLCWTCSWSLGH